MSFAVNLPLFCIVASLVCSVVSSVLNGKHARWLSMWLSFAVAVSSLLVLGAVRENGEPITYIMGHFPTPGATKFGWDCWRAFSPWCSPRCCFCA